MAPRAWLALTLLVLGSLARAQEAPVAAPPKAELTPTAGAIVTEARKSSQVMVLLDELTNGIGPRLTGSEALVTACDWAVSTFERFGLKNVHVEAWGEVKVSFNRGPWFGWMVWKEGEQEHREALTFNTPAWSAGTKGRWRGRAILEPANEEELKKVESRLKGAWLVRKPPRPRPRIPRRPRIEPTATAAPKTRPQAAAKAEPEAPPAAAPKPRPEADPKVGPAPAARERPKPAAEPSARPAPSARGAREPRRNRRQRRGSAVLEKCEKAGILGVVSGARGNLLRTGSNRRVRWNRMTWDQRPTLVRPTLVARDHTRLMRLLEKGVDVHLEFIVQNRFRRGPTKLLNVVADIPGVEKPDEFVLVGGHLDSWDGATGAVDDGSGCATAMEAARLLMKIGARPKRTIRFVLWGGEEQGLLGSRAYVTRHKEELPRISAYLNHDSGTNYVAGIPCTKAMKADMERVFQGVIGIDPGKPFKITETNGLRGGGSDHASFLRAGVPAFMWRLAGNHEYGYIWHTQNDHYDQAVAAYQLHSSMVIAIGALGLADLDHLLSREKMAAPPGARRRSLARFLGLEMKEMTITKVVPDSEAARAKLESGDKILRFDGEEVKDLRSLFRALFSARGQGKMVVLRNGKEVELDLAIRFGRRRR